MTTGSEMAGWGEWGARGGGQGSTGAPDFVRGDRGEVDDHWSRAVEQACGKCEAELTARDFVRRRHDGSWVHEDCPRSVPTQDGLGGPSADGSADDG